MEDDEIFRLYCKKYDHIERPYYDSCRLRIKKTGHYKAFELSVALAEFKSSVKEALPKWLKWLIN